MSDIAQMMRAANPVPDTAAALPDAELDALLILTKARSETMAVDQLERPVKDRVRPVYRRNPWLVAAAAFAIVLTIGVAWAVFAGVGAEPDVVEPGPDDRPQTLGTAVLGADPAMETYFLRSAGEFDAAVMGVEPGAVTAEWYRADGFLVVFFAGVDTTVTEGLCPRAAIAVTDPELGADFGDDFLANAAAAGADCSAIVINELPDPSVRTLQCDGSLAFRTAIPDDAEGTLIAALDRAAVTPFGSSRGVMGIEGRVSVDPESLPEVDLGLFEC